MTDPAHRPMAALARELAEIRAAPAGRGRLELIVRRPAPDRRDVVDAAELDLDGGLSGDNWLSRGSRATEDGSAERERQVTVMSSRAAAAIAGPRDRWPLAGDQLYVDLDLSPENLPVGTRLEVGEAELEVTAAAHTGCGKFARRFGPDALAFVNSDEGRALNLRGVNTCVTAAGPIRAGDVVVVHRRPDFT